VVEEDISWLSIFVLVVGTNEDSLYSVAAVVNNPDLK